MIRYLKYIFLIFGGLGLCIMGFFYYQNHHDLHLVWDYSDELDYEEIVEECPDAKGSYYYPCFYEEFEELIEQSGITGISFGLKLAFNFMDDDKQTTTLFETEKVRDIEYAINYLEINNLAIKNSYKRFFGIKKMYSGYLSSLRDFLEGAEKFSGNLIEGLESEEGVSSIKDEQAQARVKERFDKVHAEYKEEYAKARAFVDGEIERVLKEHEER
ncbi:MAG: hypothetical protein CME64_00490 [Halobacteriovoraceae bacterium]|nr:hypothetical protein [Halobacteriovoraceae bacterium]|tara:strand:- start:116132 stop:116776 length:645 start_codon:yes stop_codon:yes gene_type:complete